MCDKLKNNDVVKVADYGYLVGHNIVGIGEIDKHREQTLTFRFRQLPFSICQHMYLRFQHRNVARHEIRQWQLALNFGKYMADRFDDLEFVGVSYGFARLLQRFAKITQIAIAQFDRKFYAHDRSPATSVSQTGYRSIPSRSIGLRRGARLAVGQWFTIER